MNTMPGSHRVAANRVVHVRWMKLIRLMAEGKTLQQCAALLEVNIRTLWRDVNYLRDQMGVELTSFDSDPGQPTRLLKPCCPFCGGNIPTK